MNNVFCTATDFGGLPAIFYDISGEAFTIDFWDAFGASRFVSNNVRQKVRQARIHNKIIDKNYPKYKDEKIRINRSFYNDCLRDCPVNLRLKH